jgi:hypothetical protein
MYLPNEIWKNIILPNSLCDARLMNKEICFLCQDTFIKEMYVITKDHKLDYYNKSNAIAFYGHDIYISKNKIMYNYDIYSRNTRPINIKRIIYHYSIDLLSTYNVLKEREIYKKNFAKEETLKTLRKTRISLYTKAIDDIVRYYVWLNVNLMLAGLVENIDYDRNLYNHYKLDNVDLYQKLENYIKSL